MTPFPSALASVALLLLSPHPLGPPQLNSASSSSQCFCPLFLLLPLLGLSSPFVLVESSSDSHPSPCPPPHPAPHQPVPTVPSCCPSGLPQRQLHLLGRGLPLVCGTHLPRPPSHRSCWASLQWLGGWQPQLLFPTCLSSRFFQLFPLLSFLGIRRPLARRGGKPWMGGHRWGRDRGSPGGSGQEGIWSWE